MAEAADRLRRGARRTAEYFGLVEDGADDGAPRIDLFVVWLPFMIAIACLDDSVAWTIVFVAAMLPVVMLELLTTRWTAPGWLATTARLLAIIALLGACIWQVSGLNVVPTRSIAVAVAIVVLSVGLMGLAGWFVRRQESRGAGLR